uniref:Uncharacterized protein n=1 Tax=Octopus bimaculoides TaxID=37653 RepID=A0A0L8GQ87_OCTBM
MLLVSAKLVRVVLMCLCLCFCLLVLFLYVFFLLTGVLMMAVVEFSLWICMCLV